MLDYQLYIGVMWYVCALSIKYTQRTNSIKAYTYVCQCNARYLRIWEHY